MGKYEGLVNNNQKQISREGDNKKESWLMNKQITSIKPPSGGFLNWIEKHPLKFLSIVTTVTLVAVGAVYFYVKMKGGAV